MRVVILGSGKGTNASAIITAAQQNQLGEAKVVGVLSDNKNSTILLKAKDQNIFSQYIETGLHKSKIDKDKEQSWIMTVKNLRPDLIVLAGFMKILSENFINQFENKIINLHPSILPSFPGLDAVEKAFNKKVKITGCTIHWVNKYVDDGEIIAQAPVRIMKDDNLELVKQKVQAAEHVLLPWVINDLALGIIPFPQ